MAKVSIPPVRLPWREKDIKSGDPELLADYLKVLVKTLQKKLEEISNVVNINAYKGPADFINIDGSTSPVADINWGGYKITNLGSPTDILDAVNEEYLAKAVSTIGSRYYMTDVDSGIEDYKLCSTNPSSSSEQSISATDVVDGQYIGGWISPNTGEPSKLLTGVFNWRIYVEKTGGQKTLRLYWKLVERKSDNSEVVIGTSVVSNEIITEKNSYIIPLTLTSDYEIASDSYVVGKIYALVSGNGNNPSLTIYYQGTSASHFQIPVNTEILDNRYCTKDDFVCSKQQNGYTKLPNGIIIQWGIATGSSSGNTVTFPITFPNACYSVVAVSSGGDASDSSNTAVDNVTASSFILRNADGWDCYWQAVGY